MVKTIYVDIPNHAYSVKVGHEILKSSLQDLFTKFQSEKVFIVTNDTVHGLYPNFIQERLPQSIDASLLILPDGEEYKNLESVNKIYDFLIENGATRKSILIAFGGGVIGDIVGFVAGTYMRGISFLQIPTTLLSQVDSSIGGKTGVNHPGGKNTIGVFKQPIQTIIDVQFLETLPDREFIAGYGELIKHGFIRDTYLFQILAQHSIQDLRSDKTFLCDCICRSCEVKARVVEQDEKESNLRATLNFGHTLGHLIETYTGYRQYLHGEAVIIGMHFAAWWSYQKKHIMKADYDLIDKQLSSLNVKAVIPPISEEDFLRILRSDKKRSSQGIIIVGLIGLGTARLFPDIQVEAIWEDYNLYLKEKNSLVEYTSEQS